MPKKRTYLDAGVLRAAFKENDHRSRQAMEILDDPERELLVSDALWLEVMPMPTYHQKQDEVSFYQAVFEAAEKVNWDAEILPKAMQLAKSHGLAAMDAIHIALALKANAKEIVGTEKKNRSMTRVPDEIVYVSI